MTVLQAKDLITSAESSDKAVQSFANLDHYRAQRTGFPEAVFAQGKTPQQVASILDSMAAHVNETLAAAAAFEDDDNSEDAVATKKNVAAIRAVLATRVDRELFEQISSIPLKNGELTYHETARIIAMRASSLNKTQEGNERSQIRTRTSRKVVVACAGTTDLPVAEEAAVTLESAGASVERVYDVGVAGLHRIVNALPKLRDPSVGSIIVCAGMDGALPSVVAGLVAVPVIACPTSVGYGASFGGISAMLTMLNSCAPGVGVVNIDNGFGAAALAFKCIHC